MKKQVIKLFLGLILTFAGINSMQAQRSTGDIGVGFQFGEPNGVSVKFYNEPISLDLLLAWKSNRYTMINGHLVFDRHIGNKNNFHFIYGPGAFLIFNDNNGDRGSDTDIGISGLFGFDYIIDNFEIFVQGIPRINLSESSDIDVGGGLGIRYYF